MKRKLVLLVFSLLLCTSFVFSVYASDKVLVTDNAGLLNSSELAALENTAQALTDTYKMDVAILTVDSLNGITSQEYADQYYDRNGFADDGLLFLLAMEEREWYICTSGNAIYAFTDYGLERLGDAVVPYLSSENYAQGFDYYLNSLYGYFDAYMQGTPIDGRAEPYDPSNRDSVVYYDQQRSFSSILISSMVIGVIVAGISILIMRYSMNTKRRKHNAGDYLKQGSFQLRLHRDIYLYSNISKVRRQQNTGSSGGSSVHRSSGGRRHGGRGGKF